PELDLLLQALADASARFGVRREDLDLVATGCEQDLRVARYDTFEELHGYCYQVASAVGLACLEVFGYRGERELVRSLAVDLGIAMQLTNIVRDVREDFERDRVYLPREDLERFGVSEAELAHAPASPRVRELLAFEARRARCYFARGRRLAEHVLRDARACPLALAAIYERLLDRIESRDYDVLAERVTLPAGRKLGLLALSLARGLLGP
ncbi:MAG: squalene/phytoene synthase family protein, partial [Planctomycetota bacterium]